MELYLVQHAEAMSKEEDPERPLTGKGRTDVDKVANFVSLIPDISVIKILHSGKTRAMETAKVLGTYLEPSGGVSASDGLAPMDDPATWGNRLAGVKENVLLVGHLPHLNKLASLLLCKTTDDAAIDFQMGSVLCLERGDAHEWHVKWMIIPRLLG